MPEWSLCRHGKYRQDLDHVVLPQLSNLTAGGLRGSPEAAHRKIKNHGGLRGQARCGRLFVSRVWDWTDDRPVYLYHSVDQDAHQVVLLLLGLTVDDVGGGQLAGHRQEAEQRLEDVLVR